MLESRTAAARPSADYLRPTDVARYLQVHPSAPVRWIRKGTPLSDGTRLFLEGIKTPGGYRIARAALDRFL